LTALADRLDALAAVSVQVREWEGDVIFLHEVKPGAADRSYGVQVARLAGLPQAVVQRAKRVLEKLEARERGDDVPALLDGLPLFEVSAAAPPAPEKATTDPALAQVAGRLAETDPDDLSPRDALDLVYELRALARRP
ncbi:MAG: DNA mismatch repair protein MutS, partial [Pseudomonadota bacterium]